MPDVPKSIYAVFVGINDYQLPGAKLRGCERDVEGIVKYFDSFCEKRNIKLHSKKLLNAQATRQAIIGAFDLFDEATNEDACVFYYSGHGALCPVPDEFRDLEPNQRLETLVCVDSRIADYDLADKELAWLIWQATKNKPQLSFLSIIDCCHSGGITRDITSGKAREIEEIEKKRAFTQFLGHEDYININAEYVNLHEGNHILLAASSENQTAKEAKVNNESVGVFTYFLLKYLKESDANMSYQDLMDNIGIRIANAGIKEQRPKLIASAADKEKTFLSTSTGQKNTYSVNWDKKRKSWCVGAGKIQGLKAVGGIGGTILRRKDTGEELVVSEIFPNYGIVLGMENSPKEESYAVEVVSWSIDSIAIGIGATCSEKTSKLLENLFQEETQDYPHFKFTTSLEEVTYIVQERAQEIFLTSKSAPDIPIFSTASNIGGSAIKDFLVKLETVGRWKTLLDISSSRNRIQNQELDIALYQVSETEEQSDKAAATKIDFSHTIPAFQEKIVDNEKSYPAFRLCITNKGRRTLWVSLSYFGADFSISNDFLDVQELRSGEQVWAMTKTPSGIRQKTIALWIDSFSKEQAKSTIEEYLKINVSTAPFTNKSIAQKGLMPKAGAIGTERGAGPPPGDISRPAWKTYVIPLQITSVEEK